MDLVKTALIANLAAILVALISAGVIAGQNAGSRNLALATGTLAAAMILFIIQLPFELQRSVSHDHISTEFTIDRSEPSIRQWNYTDSAPWRLGAEVGASAWLASNNPAAFQQDRDKLTMDLALLSVLSFLAHHEFDWQVRKTTYRGKASGAMIRVEPTSKEEECTAFTPADLASWLSQAGNLFANRPIFVTSGRLCFPPTSTVEISARSLLIRNPICEVAFGIQPSGGISYTKPGTGGEVPKLASGESQFETRLIGLRVKTTFFALRAQHRHSAKYREWCSRVIDGARKWFES